MNWVMHNQNRWKLNGDIVQILSKRKLKRHEFHLHLQELLPDVEEHHHDLYTVIIYIYILYM